MHKHAALYNTFLLLFTYNFFLHYILVWSALSNLENQHFESDLIFIYATLITIVCFRFSVCSMRSRKTVSSFTLGNS